MTLQASGPISLGQIASEFGLAANAVFPNAFYGLGGAPGSGPLSFSDFYGRSAGPMTASASPSSLNRTGTAASLSTNTTTVTPANGTAPYIYSWAKISGDNISIGSPSSAATAFSASGLSAEETRSAVFRCTVTATGGATATADVSVSITRTSA